MLIVKIKQDQLQSGDSILTETRKVEGRQPSRVEAGTHGGKGSDWTAVERNIGGR